MLNHFFLILRIILKINLRKTQTKIKKVKMYPVRYPSHIFYPKNLLKIVKWKSGNFLKIAAVGSTLVCE